jgi:ubiquinone/menaquinone biosynthesis C-methylase UbiE
MRLNWAERLAVNNPLRVLEQIIEVRRLKKMVTPRPGFVALEMGCGRGAGARIILRELRPSHLYAQDLDVKMIAQAKTYLSPEEKQKCSLFVGDGAALPVKTGSLDCVFGFGVLHHIPDWRAAIAEVSRALKPGGVYFLEDLYPSLYQNCVTKYFLLHPTEDRFFGTELKEALAEAKLPLLDVVEFKRLGLLGAAIKE